MTDLAPRYRRLAIVAVALGQTAALLWIVAGHARHLATGREIVLDVIPVDPRALFLGDYVIVTTDAHQVPREAFRSEPEPGTREVHAVLAPRSGPASSAPGTATWYVREVHGRRPAAVGPGEVVMRGQLIERAAEQRPARIRYGIESYFVPEGKGREIEQRVGAGRVQVTVAVAADGRAAIKALAIDGAPVYADPLW